MKPPPFDYVRADSVDAAIAALRRSDGDAKLLAGGQSLVPMLNFRLLRPSLLVDITPSPGSPASRRPAMSCASAHSRAIASSKPRHSSRRTCR